MKRHSFHFDNVPTLLLLEFKTHLYKLCYSNLNNVHLRHVSNVCMIFAYIIDRNMIDKVPQFYVF